MKKIETPKTYINNAGTRIWYLPSKGKSYWHRLSGPAVEHMNGTKEWWVHGKRHRIDGPAIHYHNGRKEWFVDGKMHRVDGPAVEHSYGHLWYIDGIWLPTSQVEEWIRTENIDLTLEENQLALKLMFIGEK